MRDKTNIIGRLIPLLTVIALGSCELSTGRVPETVMEQLNSEADLIADKRNSDSDFTLLMGDDDERPVDEEAAATSESFEIPPIRERSTGRNQYGTSAPPPFGARTVETRARELSLPNFVDIAFGELLDVPYFTGPGVANRTDVSINLRSAGEMPAQAFFELIKDVLSTYGVAVIAEDGVYKIVEDAALQTRMPLFVRGRATTDTPNELRPLVMFVELEAMNANEMESILRQAFPRNSRLQISANPKFNIVTLNGLPDDVTSALAIIEELDELSYAGTQLELYRPEFVLAKDLATELNTVLSAEGWQSSANSSVERTILIVPIEFSNQLFIFSKSAPAMVRVRFWLSQLDQPAQTGDVPQIFVYSVQNVDARLLADTVNAVLDGGSNRARDTGPTPLSPDGQVGTFVGAQPSSLNESISGALVVDTISNRLIFSGTSSEYARLKPLLEQLDRAPGEVMILVTIAEITLTDETRYGLDFFVDSLGTDAVDISVGTGGLGVGSDGLQVGILSGNVDIALNAFARNNQVNVLSKPKLMARSGGAARLQVGTDVPIITSQRAASSQDGVGQTDILQSVEYRKTGVLLTIEPIIFSQNRIDLAISQEVSTTVPNPGSEIASPTISNRTLETQLSVQDGETVILGGLIQNTTTENETGVPLLKDIPIAGNLFRNNSIDQTRTELLVMITAYILRDRDQKAQLTDTLLNELQRTIERGDNFDTLLRDFSEDDISPEIDLSPDESE